MPDEKYRMTLVMSQTARRHLEDLLPATGRADKTSVIGDAVDLYTMVVAKIREGKRVFIGDTPGTAAELVLIRVENAPDHGRAS